MRRTTLAALVLVFVLAVFTGCGTRDDSSSKGSTTTVTTTTTIASSETETSSEEAGTTVATVTSVETTSETETSSVTESEPDTKSSRVVLDVKNIQMLPELPRGSEITSAAIVLNYFGIQCDKMDLLQYLPMVKEPIATGVGVWASPLKAFCGDPSKSENSFGCFSPVIEKTVNDYLAANNITGYTVESPKNMWLDELYPEIDNGNPIIIWTTLNMEQSLDTLTWNDENGEAVVWPTNEHCVVMVGYDTEKNTIILCDPLDDNNTVEYPADDVMMVHNLMSSGTVIIRKA